MTLYEVIEGGSDTHALAEAAKAQAERMKDLACRMKEQADRTKIIAEQAIIQAKAAQTQASQSYSQTAAMNRQVALLTANQIPFLSLKDAMRSTENYGADVLVKWTDEWENSGGGKPLNLLIWDDCHDAREKQPLDFYRRQKSGIPVVIAPQH